MREELYELASMVNSGADTRGVFFALDCDISLSGLDWKPIGTAESPFLGSFDGRGRCVTGLRADVSHDYAGLFGLSFGAIERIVLSGAYVRGGSHTGGIVGCGSAEGCVSHAEVCGTAHVGGVAGSGTVFSCESSGRVEGGFEVGGVIGTGDAYSSRGTAAVSGVTRTGSVSGVGVCRDCWAGGPVSEKAPAGERATKHSVAKFIRFALSHIDPASIPTNANLFVAAANCGTSPWEYLYGSVRAVTSNTTLNTFYNNNYTKYMLRPQYDEITADWSRSTYATDCQGMLDAWMTYEEGVTTDINVQMNYTNWCTNKGEISAIDRAWVVGEAVFVWSERLGKMGHIGWVCGFDEDGEPLIVEARGVSYGVVVTRLKDRAWTHRGLMTVQFNYDASMKQAGSAFIPEPDIEPAEFDPEVPAPRAVWDGSIASSYAGGSGTQDDPYLISTPAQLAYLSYKVQNGTTYSGKYFALTADIWLNSTDGWTSWDYFNQPANEWTPIGCYTTNSDKHIFSGSFDGRGHTVYGVFFSHNRKSFFGLFGYVGNNPSGVIKDLTVSKCFMEAVDNVGGIVGYLENYGGVQNCVNGGKVRASLWAGGIVGYITNSSGTTEIKYCSNLTSVRGSSDVGGIVGWAHDNTKIYGCTNAASFVKSYERTGGVVGTACAGTVIENCRNNGELRGARIIGGVAGCMSASTLKKCYSGHDISTGFITGGVVGMADSSTVSDAFSTGDITCVEKAGGVAAVASGTTVISRCYSVGTITARRVRGGVLGSKQGSASLSNTYCPTGCCAGGNSYGTAMEMAAFASEESYAGFDMSAVWKIDPDTQYPFAELRAAAYTSDKMPDYTAPDPTPTPTAEPTEEPTPTPPADPSHEPTPTPTADPSDEPTPTPTPTADPSDEPTPTPTADPSEEPTPTPTADPSDDPTPTPTAEPTPTPDPTPTPTPDPGDPSNYPVPTRTLRRGDTGEDVMWLQAALNLLGYPLEIDGVFGQATFNAVVAFQTDHGLEPDGICGPLTRAAILEALAALAPPDALPGDVNGDGSVNSTDALAVLRYSMGLIGLDPDELERADVDSSGTVDSADALTILRMALGIVMNE